MSLRFFFETQRPHLIVGTQIHDTLGPWVVNKAMSLMTINQIVENHCVGSKYFRYYSTVNSASDSLLLVTRWAQNRERREAMHVTRDGVVHRVYTYGVRRDVAGL